MQFVEGDRTMPIITHFAGLDVDTKVVVAAVAKYIDVNNAKSWRSAPPQG